VSLFTKNPIFAKSLKKIIMKKILYVTLCLLLCSIFSCNKEKDAKVLNITAINSEKSKIVNVKTNTMEQQSFSIGCHDAFSKIFDKKTNIFGYQDCGKSYHLIDVENFTEIKQITLPAGISLVVSVPHQDQIIGHYYDGSDHVLTVNRKTGEVVYDKKFASGVFWDATTYFFLDAENEYVLLRSDNVLVFVDPATGNINRTLPVQADVGNGIYDKNQNRLIGTTYSDETNHTDIVTIDLNSGQTLSKVVAQGLDFYLAGEQDYDEETNSYILVNSNNEVLFFNVETGEVTERYQLDFDITSLSVWRSKK
jgi:hypothetical protein